MQPMIPDSDYSSRPLPLKAVGLDVAFLRKVYLLVTASVGVSAAFAAFALFAGTGAPGVEVPPLVAWFAAHPIIAILMMFGATFGASAVARKPGLNVLALFLLAGLMGLFIAPAVYVTQLMASQGQTLSPSPVLHAFALAVAAFVGLSGYALVSRRDFSFLHGFVSMGLFVVIGASLLNLFFGGAMLSLGIASAAVLLFGAFILYDTSRMLRSGENEPVPAALGLYLNFLNLFLALLRIFGSRRD